MSKLFVRSVIVLALLFGLLFAVGTAVMYHYALPLSWAIGLSVLVVTLQFIFGPKLIDWIFKINWMHPRQLSPEFEQFLADICAKRRIPVPRFGVIEDSNPNAFTYGHFPSDARLVVTRGLLQMLNRDEYEAVVAHEIGHIRHYDFIVMSIAALVPLMLYHIYIWTRDRRQVPTLAVAAGAYLAYIISQYLVLFLSRVREYYADEHAAQSVANSNAIATALVKIAYGLARIPQQDLDDQNQKRKRAVLKPSQLMGSLGLCNFSAAVPMALYATNAQRQFSVDQMVKAMQWDLWNPWARFFELQSTHPLVARRVQAASRIAMIRHQQPALPTSAPPRESYWSSFFVDLVFLALPWIGLILGLSIAFGSVNHNVVGAYESGKLGLHTFGYPLLFAGMGWLLRLSLSFGGSFRRMNVADLVGEMDVSHIRSIPVEIEGQVIGRGVPGLFWSKDLVLQDDTGFITAIYRQPLSIFETIFGLMSADRLVGQKATFRGWYRRGPAPYLEIKNATFELGSRVNCHWQAFLWTIAFLCTAIGALLLFA